MLPVLIAMLLGAAALPPQPPLGASSYEARQRYALEQHVRAPYPPTKAGSSWGVMNHALATLALLGPHNATVARQISAEVTTWADTYRPFLNCETPPRYPSPRVAVPGGMGSTMHRPEPSGDCIIEITHRLAR